MPEVNDGSQDTKEVSMVHDIDPVIVRMDTESVHFDVKHLLSSSFGTIGEA